MKLSRREFTGLLVPAILGVGGCRSSKARGKHAMAFSNANNAEPYRAAQQAMIERLAALHPEIALFTSDGQQDNNTQIAQVEAFIRERPGVLIVAPNEAAALTDVMGEAMDSNIPVICLERDILQPNYTTYIRADNEAIGHLAGEFIVKNLTERLGAPRGKVVMIRGLLGIKAGMEREMGARNVLRNHPDIEIVADPVANWNESEAKDHMTEVLRIQPVVNLVYGLNDPMAVGAYLAAKDLGREKEMSFVGIDGLGGPAGGIKKVIDGILQATFIYPLCIDKAFAVALQMLETRGFVPYKTYTMTATMVTPENAAALYQSATVEQ